MNPAPETQDPKPDHLLLRAIRGEKVERPPVWAMRQAGRWDPEFNKLRGKLSFYEFSENAELAAQASLLPRRFGVDAIILFYDITTLAVAMGMPFDLIPEKGPVPKRPLRSLEDVRGLEAQPSAKRFEHVLRILKIVKKELADSLPVIVFAGAPFTLASYCIGTGKELNATRRFAQENAAAWNELLDRLATATTHFLGVLADEGADVYQLFDSWAGGLQESEYKNWAETRHFEIFSDVPQIPSILFVKECPHWPQMMGAWADAVSLGTSHNLGMAREQWPTQCLQGNVDAALLSSSSPDEVFAATRRCIAATGGQRHIVNLNHGVQKNTPIENFEAFVQAALSWTP